MEPLPDSPELERLYRNRQDCIERLGRIAVEVSRYHQAQTFNINLLLEINDRIRLAGAPHHGDD